MIIIIIIMLIIIIIEIMIIIIIIILSAMGTTCSEATQLPAPPTGTIWQSRSPVLATILRKK